MGSPTAVLNLRSRREIERMRPAGRLVAEALAIASETAKPGVTTREIDDRVGHFYKKHQALPLFLDYPNPTPRRPPFPCVSCISVNEEVVHGIPGDRVLVEGDIISIDTGCKLKGWCGDSAMTVAVGQVDPEVSRLLDVTSGVLEMAIEQMGKCRWWSEVAAQMAKFVEEAGFYVVESFVGHGIGREMHEDPQVPNFVSKQLKRRGDFRLEPGLVIAIEPMVNMGTKEVISLEDDWTQSTSDGLPSAHFEHTVAMTDEGPLVLTTLEGHPVAAT